MLFRVKKSLCVKVSDRARIHNLYNKYQANDSVKSKIVSNLLYRHSKIPADGNETALSHSKSYSNQGRNYGGGRTGPNLLQNAKKINK